MNLFRGSFNKMKTTAFHPNYQVVPTFIIIVCHTRFGIFS